MEWHRCQLKVEEVEEHLVYHTQAVLLKLVVGKYIIAAIAASIFYNIVELIIVQRAGR